MKTITEANPFLASLLQNPNVSTAHHISYANSITNEMENVTGHSDDGDIGASDVLKTVIQEKGLSNIFQAFEKRDLKLLEPQHSMPYLNELLQ